MRQIRASQLAEWLADGNRQPPLLLDVREPWELAYCQIEGSLHVPMHLIPLRAAELPKDRPVVVICRSGARSGQVCAFLAQQGYTNMHNLAGGVMGWARAGGTFGQVSSQAL